MYAIIGKSGRVYDVIPNVMDALEAYDGPNTPQKHIDDETAMVHLDYLLGDSEEVAGLKNNPVFLESIKEHFKRLGWI